MDPYKGGIRQEILTFFLKIILHIAFFFLKIIYRDTTDEIVEPGHLIPPPDKPIPSLKLANALNPETPSAKLVSLSTDEDVFIRRAVCRNPALSKDLLEKLLNDEDSSVRDEAKMALKKRAIFDPKGYELPTI